MVKKERGYSLMVKKEKGSIGYLTEKKKYHLIYTLVAFAVILAIFFAGLLIFKNRNNYMTLVSVMLCLPGAKIAVGYFILLPHQSCSYELYEKLEAAAPMFCKKYDLVISNVKKPIGVQACVITENCICVYTNETGIDKQFFETSIVEFIKNEKLSVTVTMYTDEEIFFKRVRGLSTNYNETNVDNINQMKWNSEALLHMCI